MILNCIAIDDEPPALDLLCRFIQQTPFLILGASFSNGIESLRYINENNVAVIFLDIQMPDLSGIELARILKGRNTINTPAIIFTTAFDQFALEGFKVDAVDYLLKPFGYQEFLRAANKALKWAELNVNSLSIKPKDEDVIYLKVDSQKVKIPCQDIIYIEGLKDYAKIHLNTSEKSILTLITLKAMEDKLPKGRFMRIHNSFIVSLDKISSVTKTTVFLNKTMLPVSDKFKEEFSKFIDRWQ
ncbi:LytR/AlgR family response regulator transcription factor [Mucilaginibacter glaciei]|uniref:Response regulator transcription factor n=1 Tax=Mucilaginibacter glaciei TaxID=2772109 RepID=A0A926NQZ5_9SPHI|nr:LytTR family DNA-binding domain-containing protein [Mucilaginibacter glaciei]MBD1393422.1 response regulator transcription factor [Mucilaginibacter glaciei]